MDPKLFIKKTAEYINNNAKGVRKEAEALAQFIEKEFKNRPQTNISDFHKQYNNRDKLYYIRDIQSEVGFKQVFATGHVPVNDRLKQKLKFIETFHPKILEVYKKNNYIDEVWYLDKESIGSGNTHTNVLPRIPAGADIGGEYDKGERAYSRFGIIGPIENPKRKSLWSPNALIEIFDEFVISGQAPVYSKTDLIGKISIHYNLIYLRNNTIDKKEIKGHYFLFSSQYTLIGMSPDAKKLTGFPEYHKKRWDSKQAKMTYVDNDLNLYNLNKEMAEKLNHLKPEEQTSIIIKNKKYTLIKENIPDINFWIAALY